MTTLLIAGIGSDPDLGAVRPLAMLATHLQLAGEECRWFAIQRHPSTRLLRSLQFVVDPLLVARPGPEVRASIRASSSVAYVEHIGLADLMFNRLRKQFGRRPSVSVFISIGSEWLDAMTILEQIPKPFGPLYTSVVLPLKERLIELAARWSDVRIAPTCYEAEWLEARTSAPVSVVPWGYQTWRDAPKDNPRRLIWFDNWTLRKNWPWFVKVVDGAVERELLDRVDIFGASNHRGAIYSELSVRAKSKVVIHDRLPYTDLIDELAKGGIYCSPSYSEGFGLARLEAVAAGCVLLATPTGWVRDYQSDLRDLLLDPADPNRGLALYERMVAEPALRESAIAALRRIAQPMTWSQTAHKFLAATNAASHQ